MNRKQLLIYDFDDTLVKTESYIYVNNSITGSRLKLTPGEYATYEPLDGDDFDYSDFETVNNPQEIEHNTTHFRNSVRESKDDTVYILTARAHYKPIRNYLKNIGINTDNVYIVALADANPHKKSEWIETMIDENEYSYVYFIDDSHKNVSVTKEMLMKKDIEWDVHHAA
jgi:hypothetical protein